MSALFIMRYTGSASSGFGAIYIGRGTIVGVDVGNGRYSGSYVESNGRIQGRIMLIMPTGGTLVTGQQVPPGTSIPLRFDWPENFTGPQTVSLPNQNVQVTLEKVGDIP